MSWFLPVARGTRAALATSLLLLVPWSFCAATVLAALGAWQTAIYAALAPLAAAAATALVALAADLRDDGAPEDDEEEGGGGQRRDPPPPRSPGGGPGADPDWAAFDVARDEWEALTAAGARARSAAAA